MYIYIYIYIQALKVCTHFQYTGQTKAIYLPPVFPKTIKIASKSNTSVSILSSSTFWPLLVKSDENSRDSLMMYLLLTMS